MKIRIFLMITSIVASVGITTPAISDDTEIYLNPNAGDAAAPIVMLSLDYRDNLGSAVCSGYEEDANGYPVKESECGQIFYEAAECESTEVQILNDLGEVLTGDDGNPLYETVESCNDTQAELFLPQDSTPLTPSVNFFEIFRAVLKVVMEPLDGVKIGLMLNHNNNNNCAGPQEAPGNNQSGCSNGGYIFLGAKLMTTDPDSDDFGNKAAFHAKLAKMPIPEQGSGHSYQGAELFFEFFRYLTGQNVYNGHNGYTDYDTEENDKNLDDTTQRPGDPPNQGLRAAIAWDTDPSVQTQSGSVIAQDGETEISPWYRYVSPIEEECTSVYTVNFMFAVSNQENDSDDAIKAPIAEGGMGIEDLSRNDTFTDVLRELRETNLTDGSYGSLTATDWDGTTNVTSYFFIGDNQVTQANLKGYSLAGGTGPSAYNLDTSNIDKIKADLENVLNSIISVSTTFVSATVPVNTFNRSESLDNVYFGMFEPEKEKQWPGNVKRLKLAVTNTGVLTVQDVNEDEAIDAIDGRIKSDALTFWTVPSGRDVVAFDEEKQEQSGTDGKSVSRGGAGQKVQGFIAPNILNDAPSANNDSGRQLFTDNADGDALIALNADSGTAEALWPELCPIIKGRACDTTASPDTWAEADDVDSPAGYVFLREAVNDDQEAIDLIKFARGIDVYNHDEDDYTDDSRPWLFADILHSRPVPVNYGATGGGYDEDNPELFVLIASNDGYVRAVRNNDPSGNHDSTEVSKYGGQEVWAFMPREMMETTAELAENVQGTHPYGVDGTISIYRNDENFDGTINNDDQVIVMFGLRRGGKSYYALDVTDPDSPELLWRITKGGDFPELGQSWSRPEIKKLDWGEGIKPVAIFAGGYDTDKDSRDYFDDEGDLIVEDDDEGNALYIVDLEDGSLVWKAVKGDATDESGTTTDGKTVFEHADLDDSIPSDITVMDANGDGVADRVYVGDTGGRVWRADIAGNDPTEWTITPVLSMGRHADGEPDRRFFHRPDLVQATDNDGAYDAVLIGSGNRPDPTQSDFFDRFFMFKDRNTVSGTPPDSTKTPADLADMTERVRSDPDLTGDELDDLNNNGWYITLAQPYDDSDPAGEKMLSTSLTFKGTVFFTTYRPNVGISLECGPSEGLSYNYVVNLDDASPYYESCTEDCNPEGKRQVGQPSPGITSDPITIVLDGNIYITPGNIPTEEKFRKRFDTQKLNKTYWYESTE
jgi:type IV pilus assembly protein PilY1